MWFRAVAAEPPLADCSTRRVCVESVLIPNAGIAAAEAADADVGAVTGGRQLRGFWSAPRPPNPLPAHYSRLTDNNAARVACLVDCREERGRENVRKRK